MTATYGPPLHECKADGEHGCEVCAEWWGDRADDLDELRADEERMVRDENSMERENREAK